MAVDLSKLKEQGNRFKEGGLLDQIGAMVLNYGATTGWKDAETSERLMNMINSDPNNPKIWEEYQMYESTVSEMNGKNIQLEQMDGDKKQLSPALYVEACWTCLREEMPSLRSTIVRPIFPLIRRNG